MYQINTEKIHLTFRSLFRLAELKRLNAPKLIIELEQENLKEKLSFLSFEEIKYLSDYYNIYIIHTSVKEACDEINFHQKVESAILKYN